MTITVRSITAAEHLGFLADQTITEGNGTTSFLQTPAWAKVKADWRGESIGFVDGDTLVGVGLILYRSIPRTKLSLAYLPEGPVLDWGGDRVEECLTALKRHCRKKGAFGVRIGPTLVHRRWSAETIKAGIADESVDRLSNATPDVDNLAAARLVHSLNRLGWKEQRVDEGFGAGQPRFNFWLPIGDRSEEEILAGMNQLWRRNIKKAGKLGVEVRQGDRGDLARFHELYQETAERDHFTGRPLAYFETMWDALRAEDPDRIRLYLAVHEGDLVAATTWVRVEKHCWYSYGASSTAKREVRGSNAIQWQMIRDAKAAGAEVYDMRGITEGLTEANSELGLIQFKVGTGGQAVEYLGEWDLPINPILHRAFQLYLKRR